MEQSPFTRIVFKLFDFLIVREKLLSNFLFLFCFSAITFFFFTTTYCMFGSEGVQQDHISKLHDLLAMLVLLSNEILLITNKAQVSSMVKFMNEPFENFEINEPHASLVRDYNREVNLYCKVIVIFLTVGNLLWYPGSLFLTFMASNVGEDECIHLSLGWVWHSESIFNFTVLNIACLFIATQRFYLRYIAIVCMIIKIKFKIRLLCVDIEAMDGIQELSKECLEFNCPGAETNWIENESGFRTQTTSMTHNCSKNASKLEKIEEKCKSMERYLDKYLRRKKTNDRIKSCMKNLVDQHVDIIEKVKLTDKNMRLPVMIVVHLGAILVALAIPKLSLNHELLSPKYISQWIEVIFLMGVIYVFNYLGQKILDESESLRQVLHNCDWTDKPQSLQQGLLIMQTVANKTLRLTIGGTYILSMATFGKILKATFSYISLIQSLNYGAQAFFDDPKLAKKLQD